MKLKYNKKTLLVVLGVIAVVAIACALAACSEQNTTLQATFSKVTVYSGEKYISPSGVAVSEGMIYASDATANSVYRLDNSGAVLRTATFDQSVNNIYQSGNYIYALVGGLRGEVHCFDMSLNSVAKVDVGHTPTAAVAVGGKLYVLNRFSNNISVVATDLSGEVSTIDMPTSREPFAVAYAQGKLFVGSHLNGDDASAAVVASNVVVVDPATNAVIKTIKLPNGASNVNDMAVSSNGNYVYVSNTFGRYTYPTTQLDRGWVNTNGFTIINAVTQEVLTGVLLDEVEQGSANPYGIDVIGEGDDAQIVCAISGLSQIATVSEKAVFDKIAKVQADEMSYDVDKIVDHVEFLGGLIKRIEVGGKGVRRIATAVEKNIPYAYVTKYFDGAISKVALEANAYEQYTVKNFSLGTQGEMTQERLGETLWYDATICYQGWESCSSCHPEGRSDGINWDEGGDGLGTPKQTKSMLYSHRTPPVLVTGAVDTAEDNVIETVMFAFRNDIGEELADCMDAFLKSLRPVESPYLNRDGTLTESALRGKQLFEDEYNCASCHYAPLYTDMEFHKSQASLDVDDSWEYRDLDTPTLVEIWRTSPWLFNGSATTMQDAIKAFVGNRPITDGQLEDLTNYVMSIGDVGEYYGVEKVIFDSNATGESGVKIVPDSKITKVIVRKQREIETDAIVILKLFDSAGQQIGDTVYGALTDMEVGDYAVVECEVRVPADFAEGGYYTVEIVDPADISVYFGSKLTVKY